MSEKKLIGDLVRESRIAYGYKTQYSFASKSGISPATLSRIENNSQKPTPQTLQLISNHLGNVSYGELMEAAGYIEVNDGSDLYLLEFLNDHERLDVKVKRLMETISSMSNYNDVGRQCLIHALWEAGAPPQENDHKSIKELYNAYLRADLEIREKTDLVQTLESFQGKHVPSLRRYFTSIKSAIPVPLLKSMCIDQDLITENNIQNYLHYPFLNKRQPDYAFKIESDSMIDVHIFDGDIVFIRKAEWAEYNGQIVAVAVNGKEGTLKRMKWSETSPKITLMSENKKYETLEAFPSEIHFCGVYAGHFRLDEIQ